MEKMKAVICTKYGPPEVLKVEQVKKPAPKSHQALVKIHAISVTASDSVIRSLSTPGGHKFPIKQLMRFMMRIFLGFTKPRNPIIGFVWSGEIVQTGDAFKELNTGDKVFGFTPSSFGAYAEFKCISRYEVQNGYVTLKPSNFNHEEAAAVTYGAALALHFMKKMTITKGDKVLIYGGSGAVGTLAIQIAKAQGATITAACGPTNFDLVKSLGAEKVIDYTKDNAAEQLEEYKYVLDAAGKNKTSDLKTAAKNAATKKNQYISIDDGLHKLMPNDLMTLRELCEAGKVLAIIDRRYPMEAVVEAHRYIDSGHKKGNVILHP
jgi:NADPH:quinone reductase-like Zn-dependent oxidoreductase